MAKKPKAPVESKKRFEDQVVTEPLQLSLFSMFTENREDFSQTISYDMFPTKFYGKPAYIGDRFLENLERTFEMNKKRYKLTIKPARITNKKTGQSRDAYPGKREELVEDALRKMAASGHRAKPVLLDDDFAVIFTRKALFDELKEMGHEYSYWQIDEALEILFESSITMESEDGDNIAAFHPIQEYGIKGRDGDNHTYVKFCSLVTESIQNNAFRLINYKKLMRYSSIIARKLHKRMANRFIYADENKTYNISLSTIFRDFGLNEEQRVTNKFIDVKEALEELKEAKVISSYEERKIHNQLKKNKIDDYVFEIFPHQEFIDEVIKANKDVKRRETEMRLKELLPDMYKKLR